MSYIYLAVPMDQNRLSRAMVTVSQLQSQLAGHATFSPVHAWSNAKGVLGVQTVNLAAVRGADLLVAAWPDGVSSTGVPMEIGYAMGMGIPVVLVTGLTPELPTSLLDVPTCPLSELQDTVDRMYVAHYLRELHDPDQYHVEVQLDQGAMLPTRSHHGDAGFDLYVLEETLIEAGKAANVHSGVRIGWPGGVWGMVVGRSSTWHTKNLQVIPAVIDQGYTGELFVAVQNMGTMDYWARPGERLAQVIPLPVLADSVNMVGVGLLAPRSRGEAGVGSTGV